MNTKRKVLLCGAAILVALMLLFLPHFWKIDDGVAWDVTYNWAFAPARYVGTYSHECQSATNFGGIEWGLVAFQALAVLFVTVIAWTLSDDRKAKTVVR